MEVIKTLEGRAVDRIKTFKDACDELDINHDQWLEQRSFLSKSQIAFCKLELIIQVMNEGWEADMTSNQQVKWYPWFNLPIKSKNGIGGSGFSLYDCGNRISITGVGGRLYTKNEDLCRYIATQFIDIYRDLIYG